MSLRVESPPVGGIIPWARPAKPPPHQADRVSGKTPEVGRATAELVPNGGRPGVIGQQGGHSLCIW